MNKRILLSGFMLLSCSLLFFAAAFYWRIYRPQSAEEGKPLFAATVSEPRTDRVILKNSDYTVTLVRENNYWKVAEADFYYANSLRLEKLFNAFDRAVYSLCMKETGNGADKYGFRNGLKIQTYAGEKLLDAYSFGNNDPYNQYRFFRPSGENKICQTETKFDFPQKFYSWLQQPLMQLLESDVREIKIIADNGKERLISRTAEFLPLLDTDSSRSVNLQNFFDVTGFLSFTDVLSARNFSEDTALTGTIDITLFSGLVYKMQLFRRNDSFWLKVNLSSTALPTAGIGDYIKDNAFLYDGWYFRLSTSKGKVLSDLIAD